MHVLTGREYRVHVDRGGVALEHPVAEEDQAVSGLVPGPDSRPPRSRTAGRPAARSSWRPSPGRGPGEGGRRSRSRDTRTQIEACDLTGHERVAPEYSCKARSAK